MYKMYLESKIGRGLSSERQLAAREGTRNGKGLTADVLRKFHPIRDVCEGNEKILVDLGHQDQRCCPQRIRLVKSQKVASYNDDSSKADSSASI